MLIVVISKVSAADRRPLDVCVTVCVCRPDLIDWARVCLQTPRENLQLAFDIAERVYNVTQLLEPEGE